MPTQAWDMAPLHPENYANCVTCVALSPIYFRQIGLDFGGRFCETPAPLVSGDSTTLILKLIKGSGDYARHDTETPLFLEEVR